MGWTEGWHIVYEIRDPRIGRIHAQESTMPDDIPANETSPRANRPLRNIYTYGGRPARRNLTVADIRANKAAGVKMTQVSAQTRDEVA